MYGSVCDVVGARGGWGGGLRHQYLMVTCLLGHAQAPGSGPSICLFAGTVFPVLHSFSSTERARGWWNISPLGFCTDPSSRCSRSRGGEPGWENGGGGGRGGAGGGGGGVIVLTFYRSG